MRLDVNMCFMRRNVNHCCFILPGWHVLPAELINTKTKPKLEKLDSGVHVSNFYIKFKPPTITAVQMNKKVDKRNAKAY